MMGVGAEQGSISSVKILIGLKIHMYEHEELPLVCTPFAQRLCRPETLQGLQPQMGPSQEPKQAATSPRPSVRLLCQTQPALT